MPLKRPPTKVRIRVSCCDAVSYTREQLQAVYNEIARERPQECNNCRTKSRLSHSHLISRSYSSRFALVKKNIVYHCLDTIEGPGCHSKFEGVMAAQMNDFEENFAIIYELDRTYFYLRMHKLIDAWKEVDQKTFERVMRLYNKFDKT